MKTRPKFYRPTVGNRISWEIWDWNSWFITLSFFTFEMQLNKWRKDGNLY